MFTPRCKMPWLIEQKKREKTMNKYTKERVKKDTKFPQEKPAKQKWWNEGKAQQDVSWGWSVWMKVHFVLDYCDFWVFLLFFIPVYVLITFFLCVHESAWARPVWERPASVTTKKTKVYFSGWRCTLSHSPCWEREEDEQEDTASF